MFEAQPQRKVVKIIIWMLVEIQQEPSRFIIIMVSAAMDKSRVSNKLLVQSIVPLSHFLQFDIPLCLQLWSWSHGLHFIVLHNVITV